MNSMASAAASTTSQLFYLFKSPLVVSPSFELLRWLANKISKSSYKHYTEPNFTDEGFKCGVKKGVTSCADAIRLCDQERLNYLLTTPASIYVQRRLDEIPQELINDRLSFNEDNIIHVFNHSHFYSSDRFLGFMEKDRVTFYTTSVAFIDKKSTEPIPQSEVQKRLDDLLVCNITFARIIGDKTRWRISDLNFFDGKTVRYY